MFLLRDIFSRLLAGRLGRSTTLTTFARRTALTTLTALPLRARRSNLVAGQFAITILIELLERGGGIGNFLFIEFTVMIRIKRSHHRPAHHALPTALPTLTGTTLATLPTRTATALTRRTIAAGTLIFVLSRCKQRGNAQHERGQ